jgi:hypothetical protein
VWWTATGHLAAAWVDVDHPDELAAKLTARIIAVGWSAETSMVIKRQGMTVLQRAQCRRSLGWGSRHVFLYDADGPVTQHELTGNASRNRWPASQRR